MWTRRALQNLLAERLQGRRLIVVSHDAPDASSRLASSLNPLMCAMGGTWVAFGSASASGHAVMPPDAPAYRVRRVPLSPGLETEYYHGLANQGLWPLCHAVFHRPIFERRHWEAYRQANALLAEAVLEEAGNRPAVIFVQDYPLALLPRMVKACNPGLLVAQFWHLPWPNRETFRIFPWKQELLRGLLANDLLGFHQRYDCCNFLDSVDCGVEARIDREHSEITHAGKTTLVRPFPMGIDAQRHAAAASAAAVDREMAGWQQRLGQQSEFLGIGIDRLDCTSGVPERLRALDILFERYPEYCGRLTFVQVASDGPLSAQIVTQVEEINTRWANRFWRPVVLVRDRLSPARLMALHRLASFCLVGSLHEGMNLVAKEFVASRGDGDGVLILSRYAGAAAEFPDAIQVNPFAEDEIVSALDCALRLPVSERRRRMRRLREAVSTNNVYRWAGKILSALLRVEAPEAQSLAAGQALAAPLAAVPSPAHIAVPLGSQPSARL